jgi:thiol-disulfide isomerase/thioredoxin
VKRPSNLQSIPRKLGFIFFAAILILVYSSPGVTSDQTADPQTDWVLARYGILGRPAPELDLDFWIDGNGHPMDGIQLQDLKGKVIYLYFFQDWCPGCHAHGFPTLQKLARQFAGDDRVFLMAVQTTFEGFSHNTRNKLRQNQIKYDLNIPMAHDQGDHQTGRLPQTMTRYRSGGTPWAIIIDPMGTIAYNHFHIDTKDAITLINRLLEPEA